MHANLKILRKVRKFLRGRTTARLHILESLGVGGRGGGLSTVFLKGRFPKTLQISLLFNFPCLRAFFYAYAFQIR